MFWEMFLKLCAEKDIKPTPLARQLGISGATITKWKRGAKPSAENLEKLSEYFGVSVDTLLCRKRITAPNTTDNYVTFPIIGDVAAGYDKIAMEDWEGETIDIPETYLRGRNKDEYFCLRVKGDSMFPTYQDGDVVLVLRQSTLNYSGQVGVIIYNKENASLKRVEFISGQNWLRMVAINPAYPSIRIEGQELESCLILGIPKILIRRIEE